MTIIKAQSAPLSNKGQVTISIHLQTSMPIDYLNGGLTSTDAATFMKKFLAKHDEDELLYFISDDMVNFIDSGTDSLWNITISDVETQE